MRQIDVQDQFRLGIARTFSLTVSGIRYRLFRSSITVVVIAVAIAFLMNVLSEGLIMGSVGRITRRSIREERQAARWAARLSVPGTIEDIVLEIAWSGEGAPAYAEGMRMGGLTPAEMRFYHEKAGIAARYVRYFGDLDYGPRRSLVHNARGVAIFDRLHAPREFEHFRRVLAKLKTLNFPTPTSEFRSFLDEWPKLRRMTVSVQRGRSEAQARVKEKLGTPEGPGPKGPEGPGRSWRAVPPKGRAVPGGRSWRTVMEGLAEADGEFGEVVRDAGFHLEKGEAYALAVQARRTLDMRRLEGTVLRPEMRRAVAAYVNVMPAEVNALTLWKLLRSRGSARWYYEKLADKGVDTQERPGSTGGGITLSRARDLARRKARLSALTAAERSLTGRGVGLSRRGGLWGIGERMTWLVVMAMLVCVVGVANAMLMSVTERFREIATLKCLGALDGSIMLMFVMEAGLLGAAGGVAGAIAGSAIGLGRMLAVFGRVLFSGLPTGALLVAIAVSAASGVILAGAAALYPSWTAARLAPMEAMRIQ